MKQSGGDASASSPPPRTAAQIAQDWLLTEESAYTTLLVLVNDAIEIALTVTIGAAAAVPLIEMRVKDTAKKVVRMARRVADQEANARAHTEWVRAERKREAAIAYAKRRNG